MVVNFVSTVPPEAHPRKATGSETFSEVEWRAVCDESVRRVTHGRNCHQRWPEFRANDSEANNLPGPERARGQEPVGKAGDSGRCVRCGPATPER